MVDTLNDITSALQNYIVSPLNAFGMGGYVFDAQGEAIAQLQSDITDHYTEDNKALQDHIAIKPKRITLKGYVGELVYTAAGQETTTLQSVTQKLTEINAFLPALSSAAKQLQEQITTPTPGSLPLTSTANLYSLVKNAFGAVGGASRQQNAYAYFQALQQQGILMAIQTPWEFMTNMAIETIVAIQPEESAFITDFAVTYKQIRIAATKTTAFGTGATGGTPPAGGLTLQGAASLQCTPENPIGIVPGLTLPFSALPGAQKLLTDGASFKSLSGIGNLFKVTN